MMDSEFLTVGIVLFSALSALAFGSIEFLFFLIFMPSLVVGFF